MTSGIGKTLRQTTRRNQGLIFASTASVLVFAIAGCSSPTATSESTSPDPSVTYSSQESSSPTQAQSPTQSSSSNPNQEGRGPAATVAASVGCKEIRPVSGSLDAATSVYCTDGQLGYTVTTYGSQNQVNRVVANLKKNAVPEESVTLIASPNWIIRGTESNQIGSKMTSRAQSMGGTLVAIGQ